MNIHVKSFDQYVDTLMEADGFGTNPFLLVKVEGIYHYFFNLDKEKGQVGFHLIVGKYSDKEIIEGPKNSYCVLTVNQISPELIEDIAMDSSKIPSKNNEQFKVGSDLLTRLVQHTYGCVNSYLETNPKISRIYDEAQDNLVYTGDGSYQELMKSIALSQIGTGWSIQTGSSPKTVLLSR